ncbi:hypothetical protein [Chryseobacterium sp. ERMR1:04]|uniref:hypothetical protein n=1 Tax=Chryseobacterium sp. ERMR1:04 TaxID=1705393 RepID=UPI0006C87778|nr:hypothetical protein [Chryseobacterium sp. ERMR1:04]KPH14807.1 hypothetical protein AMQ68_05055 [Chryseobacterium sp. ERMR1:04]
MNKIAITLVPICFVFFNTIDAKNRKIDSISKLIQLNYQTGVINQDVSLRNITRLYYISREAGSYIGQINSIFEESRIYYFNGNNEASLAKVNEGMNLAKANNDKNMLCRFLLLYQCILLQLKNTIIPEQILKKAEEYNISVTSKIDKEINHIYILLGKADLIEASENSEHKLNEIIAFKKNAYSKILQINDTHRLKKITVIYTLESLAFTLSYFGRLEDASHYVSEIDRLLTSFPDESLIIQSLIIKASIASNSKKYKEAIYYLNEGIIKAKGNPYKLYEMYGLLSASYEELKDFESAIIFSKKSNHCRDSISLEQKKVENIRLINTININAMEENKKVKLQNIPLTIIICIIAFGSLFYLLFYYKKYLREDKLQTILEELPIQEINSNCELLQENLDMRNIKASMLYDDSVITKKLVALAKENVNSFYIEFQRAYPDFYRSLKDQYPDLNIADLNFCSLLKMNFRIKEIAQYTNCSTRAAEARRYRINRKISLKNQDELYIVLSMTN